MALSFGAVGGFTAPPDAARPAASTVQPDHGVHSDGLLVVSLVAPSDFSGRGRLRPALFEDSHSTGVVVSKERFFWFQVRS